MADADDTVTTPRMPGWMIARSGETISMERLRIRLAAYIYGNILTLAAIAIATGETIDSGYATILVGVTTITTYLAHVIAHSVGQQLGRAPGEHRPHVVNELRDAWPILFSGLIPIAIMIIGDTALLSSELAQLLAALWVISRIALIGFLVDRLSGRTPTWRTLSGGILLALCAAGIVVLKVLFGH